MLANVSRPNFFPGQLIDYKDFNRLAEQADKTVSLLCQYLYREGGVISGAMEEFNVVPMEGLSVRVKPGLGLLPSGHPVVLTKDRIVDLSQFAGGKTSRTIIVSIRNSLRGVDRYKDETDPAIVGYKTEVMEPEIVLSTRKQSDDSLEIFRVCLRPKTANLRSARPEEEWREKLMDDSENQEGVIDLRYRKRIIPQNHSPLEVQGLIDLRSALYSIEETHRKLTKIFLIEDKFQTCQYLAQAHSEMLSVPYQPLKVSFLVSEFAKRLSLFLEYLGNHVGKQNKNLDREVLLESIEILERLRCREVLPRPTNLNELITASKMLKALLNFAEKKFNFLDAIDEALIDMKNRLAPFEDKVSLGGNVFGRVDLVDVSTRDKYHVNAESSHRRIVNTSFGNGDRLSLKGVFVKQGVFSLDIRVADPSKPVVIMQRQYVRRGGCKLHYEINGKHILSDESVHKGQANNWINKGFVIPADSLVAQENRFKVRVEQSDQDFGFFDLAVYQPLLKKEGE